MNILLSAYACQPGKGSDPGIGWNIAIEIAQFHPVWVLTRSNNQAIIEAELAKNPIPNLHIIYVDVLNWSRGWSPGTVGQLVRLHYYLWQIQAYFVVRRLHQEIQFDLVHHVTYVQYSSPSFLSLLPIPFLWGPVGGGESAPKSFWSEFGLWGQLFETVRDLARYGSEKSIWVRKTAKRSAIALAATAETAQRMKKIGCQQVQIFGVAGLSTRDIDVLAQLPMPATQPFRFISIGRLLHWKGFDLGLRAFAQLDLPHTEYWIIGNGVQKVKLKTLAKQLGIAKKVQFWGELPRSETFSKLGESHVLIHPSLHESGGWVCLEAMAAKRPIICLDLGGPGDQVTSDIGIKIKAHHPQQAIEDLARAMNRLVEDRQFCYHLGQTAQMRVKQAYSWTVKAQKLNQYYYNILSSETITATEDQEASCEF